MATNVPTTLVVTVTMNIPLTMDIMDITATTTGTTRVS
jgi:hypothetical protein